MFLANVCLEKYTVYFDRCVTFDNVWWWPVLKNLSHLHFVHRMCQVTSFYQDEILMFTRNPSTGEKSSKNFQPIQCLWNVSYYIGALRTNFLTYFESTDHREMGWWTKQCPSVHGLNPVGQLKWTTLAIAPTLRCFFISYSSVTTNTTKVRQLF